MVCFRKYSNKRLAIIIGFFCILEISVLCGIIGNIMPKATQFHESTLKDAIPTKNYLKTVLKAADNKEYYNYGNFSLIQETFSSTADINEWTKTTSTGATADTNSGWLTMEGQDDFIIESSDNIYVTYNPNIIPFHKGFISFRYCRINGYGGTVSLTLEINDGTWKSIWSDSTSSSGIWYFANISLGAYNTSYSDFSLRFYFVGQDSTDYFNVDDLKINTYEFFWTEAHDLIEPTDYQQISAYITPNFKGFDVNNVTLKFKVNNSDFSSGTKNVKLTNPGDGKNYTFTIQESNYSSSDTIYYQIWITNSSHSVYHYTLMSSFSCVDRAAPSISNIQANGTAKYYNDALVKCYISDNANGVGLKNATMYIKNGTVGFVSKSDILILSNQSGSIPSVGGHFGFTIPHNFLSARSNEQLEYCICAIDFNNNEGNSTELLLSINDNIAPIVSFCGDNSSQPSSQIGCYEALKVNYSITEPRNGVGLKSVKLLVKIGNAPPTSDNDYTFSVASVENVTIIGLMGGVLNFVIGNQYRSYDKKIYCYINATDLSTNKCLNRSDYRIYTVVGCPEPEPKPEPDPEPDPEPGPGTENAEELLFTTLFGILLIAVIGSSAIASLYVTRKVLAKKKREDLYSRLDAKKINIQSEIQLGVAIPKVEKPQQWSTIKTTTSPKQEDALKETETILTPERYWAQKIGTLTSIAVQFELENNFSITSSIYIILGRIAKRLENEELTKVISSKITDLYQKLNG